MKKLAIGLMAGLLAAGALAQGQDNAWTAPVAVTGTVIETISVTNAVPVVGVALQNIQIAITPTGQMIVSVGWAWKDADGRVVKSSGSRYTEEYLDALLKTMGSSVAQVRGMFLRVAQMEAGKSGN